MFEISKTSSNREKYYKNCRKMWSKQLILRRQHKGVFQLCRELETEDIFSFLVFSGVTPKQHYRLLQNVTPLFRCQNPDYRDCISPVECLMVTLSHNATDTVSESKAYWPNFIKHRRRPRFRSDVTDIIGRYWPIADISLLVCMFFDMRRYYNFFLRPEKRLNSSRERSVFY